MAFRTTRPRQVCLVAAVLIVLAIIATPFMLFKDKYAVVDGLKDFFAPYCDLKHPVMDSSNLPWAQAMRANARNIHAELLAFERTHIVPRISSVSSTERKLDYNATRAWRSLFLRVYGRDTIHINEFPLVRRLVDAIPHDVSMIMFSVLEPHYVGKNHEGIHRCAGGGVWVCGRMGVWARGGCVVHFFVILFALILYSAFFTAFSQRRAEVSAWRGGATS
jgi:hypothetical protein